MVTLSRLILSVALIASPSAIAHGQDTKPSPASAGDHSDRVLAEVPLSQSVARIRSELSALRQAAAPQRDSLWNGVLIGAAVGGLLGLIPDYYDDCEECHDALYASLAVGAGIGLLIDALRSDHRIVNLRGDGRHRPVLDRMRVSAGARRVGIRTTVRWK